MAGEMKPDGSYQRGHLERALTYVRDFSLAIDGGAHVGTWTKPMCAVFARVLAVEPSADTFEALTANVLVFGGANVTLHHAALGDTVGWVSMAPLDPRAAALHNTGARFVRPGGTIPLLRIDDWQLPSCGFIKLDIEGSEPLALEGARETLRRCQPIVLFENKGFWRHRYHQLIDAPQRVLASVGYRELDIVGKDVIWGPR